MNNRGPGFYQFDAESLEKTVNIAISTFIRGLVANDKITQVQADEWEDVYRVQLMSKRNLIFRLASRLFEKDTSEDAAKFVFVKVFE